MRENEEKLKAMSDDSMKTIFMQDYNKEFKSTKPITTKVFSFISSLSNKSETSEWLKIPQLLQNFLKISCFSFNQDI